MKSKMRLPKIAYEEELLISKSKSFYSIITDGKNEFLKKVFLTFTIAMLLLLLILVEHILLGFGIKSYRYRGDRFLKIMKKDNIFQRFCVFLSLFCYVFS